MSGDRGAGYWIYNYSHPNFDSLASHLEHYLRFNPESQISVFIIVSKDLRTVIEKWQSDKFSMRTIHSNDDNSIFSIRVSKVDGRLEIESTAGDVLLVRSNIDNIYFVITDEGYA